MDAYREAMEKIKASDELKQETVAMLTAAAAENARQTAVTATPAPKKTRRLSWNFARLTASASLAAMLFFCAVFIPVFSVLMLGGGDNGETPSSPAPSRREDIISEIKRTGKTDTSVSDPVAEFTADAPSRGDTVITPDGYVYSLSVAGLSVVSTENGLRQADFTAYETFVPAGLHLYQDTLVVMGGVYDSYYYGAKKEIGTPVDYAYAAYQNTKILVYNIADRAKPILLHDYTVSGYLLATDLSGNILSFATNYYFDLDDENSYFPKIGTNEIDPGKIRLYKTGESLEYRNYIITATINLATEKIDYAAHLGLYGYDTIYVSGSDLYVFNIDFSTQTFVGNRQTGVISTKIFKISMAELTCVAEARIDGAVSSRSYVDESDGKLRIVTYASFYDYANAADRSYTSLCILDGALKEIGKTQNLAVGERLYAVKFGANEAILTVSPPNTPPVRLDLSDPAHPVPVPNNDNDTAQLYPLAGGVRLGLGLNAFAENGKTQYTGLSVALYDDDGFALANLEIGDGYVYTPALYNAAFVLSDPQHNLFAFPTALWSYSDPNLLIGQGLAVFRYDTEAEDDSEKLVYCGLLSDTAANTAYADFNAYYDDGHSYINRGVVTDGKLYTVSDRFVTSYDLATLERVDRIMIADFKPASELFKK